MARSLRPRQGEPLAQFLVRAVETRGISLRELSRQAADADGKEPKTWERQLRRAKSGAQEGLDPANADIIGSTLNADFSVYAERRQPLHDVIAGVLERVSLLEQEVAALKER